MDAHGWGLFLGPLGSLLLFGVIGLGIKWLIATYMPDCWLRREILRERIPSKYSAANRKVLSQAIRSDLRRGKPVGPIR